MEDLQLVGFIIGAIAIVAVLAHGFWSIRKQQPKSMKDSPMANFYKEQADKRDSERFDPDGVGPVRVRKAGEVEPVVSKPVMKTVLKQPAQTVKTDPMIDQVAIAQENQDKQVEKRAEQPTLSTEANSTLSHGIEEGEVVGLERDPVAVHPKFDAFDDLPEDDDQPSMFDNDYQYVDDIDEFEEQELSTNKPQEQNLQASTQATTGSDKVEDETPSDVLVLHVVAKEGKQLQGAELLPALLALNFKFGDMDIFHRHIDNAGTGKVLFSLANMVKPGVFDPDNMEQFVTEGVVLFMTLPCFGDPQMNFNIMFNSAVNLAQELDAELLDGKRLPWSDSAKADYRRRIDAAL